MFSSLLRQLRNQLVTVVYVRIWRDRIVLRQVNSAQIIDDVPVLAIEENEKGATRIAAVGKAALQAARENTKFQLANGFGNPRVPVGDFMVAERTLQYFLRQLSAGRWIRPMVVLIIHPMETFEGGITQIERRALTELGENCGARRCIVYTGRELSDGDVVQMVNAGAKSFPT